MMETEENIFLFYCNIIGFFRIFLAIVSYYFALTNYVFSSICNIIQVVLDAVDGPVARHYNQCTKFGTILDLATDTMAKVCLCGILMHLYSKHLFIFTLVITLEIGCYWIYLYAMLLEGKISHKSVDDRTNPILKYYYSHIILFDGCWFGNEMFYCMLYIIYFDDGPLAILGIPLFRLLLYLCIPAVIIKSFIQLTSFVEASRILSRIDLNDRKELRKDLKK